MGDWTPERITQQQRLAMAGRAGVWMLLEGGPRNGSRGFIPHVDWPFLIMVDAEGATWSFASPPGSTPAPVGASIVGTYVFDHEREAMMWCGSDTTPEIPAVPS
jgi:hypothetical protein